MAEPPQNSSPSQNIAIISTNQTKPINILDLFKNNIKQLYVQHNQKPRDAGGGSFLLFGRIYVGLWVRVLVCNRPAGQTKN